MHWCFDYPNFRNLLAGIVPLHLYSHVVAFWAKSWDVQRAPLRWASLATMAPSTATAKRIRLKAHLGNMAPTTGGKICWTLWPKGFHPKFVSTCRWDIVLA